MAVSYILTPTLEKDSLESLFAAYKGAYPAGTSLTSFARQLVAANGVPFSAGAIDNWVFSLSGKRYPFVAGNNPGMYAGGAKNVGWAFFAAGNLIKLPDFPRSGLQVPTPDPAPAPIEPPPALIVRDKNAMLWVVGAGLALWLVVGALGKKKQST